MSEPAGDSDAQEMTTTSGGPDPDAEDGPERDMEHADEANGEGRADDAPTNDTEARYGAGESPA